jgi:hypothetical protein
MLIVIYAECHKEALFAECRSIECHYAECHYAECRGGSNFTLLESKITHVKVL